MNNKFIVYSHVNKITNVTYIGVTKRKPELRWANGFGYRTNPYFWRAIVKYGWDGFTHNILHSNLSKEEALNIEESLIAHYKSLNLSYNISDGKDYAGGLRRRPIKVYTLNGELISNCESIHQASIKFNVSESGIYYCASLFGGTTKWKDYIFLFEDDNIEDRLDYILRFHRKASNRRSIIMKSLDGSITKEFESLTEAACYINAKSVGNITECCKGNKKSYLGYTFNYK